MSERRKPYPFHEIEPKWQQLWDASRAFHAPNPGDAGFNPAQPKFYILDMFPYPSGAGLHVGHPEGYTATDIVARYKRMRGFNVLHPMGWDAFGLPAEQYAIKTGQHPAVTTRENVAKFKTQLKRIGFSYDWEREVNTTDPRYFRWTQWIFLQIYNSYFDPELKRARPIAELREKMTSWRGYSEWSPETREKLINDRRLAYVDEMPVWWCSELGTVLANEEVIDGKSEVGGFPVAKRPMRQWMLRITAFAERLIDELEGLDWPESIKTLQRNWIGRSEGATIEFEIEWVDAQGALMSAAIHVFTTRADTVYGATYLVLAPEHWLVDVVVTEENRATVQAYRARVASKSDLERTDLAKDKTGVFTGGFAINPVSRERVPIWIADYVLMTYGTGAIMAVPAHDERDWEFVALQTNDPSMIRVVVAAAAQKFCNLKPVVLSADESNLLNQHPWNASTRSVYAGGPQWVEFPSADSAAEFFAQCSCDFGKIVPAPNVTEGRAINSPLLNGLPTAAAKQKITDWLEERGLGRRTINYKLRDWLFSRQRYWGEPFPIVWRNGRHEALPESELPLDPPALEDFKPTGTGEPPLAKAKDWLRYSDAATRETNTMPQWAGSCWYYLRFCDPENDARFVGQDAESYWMGGSEAAGQVRQPGGIDVYVGGTEHAVLHLLYARFWHKVLFDLGHLTTPEPFQRLVNQGIILGEDGQKMSKSRGNVVNPDDVIDEYGADAFRCYEMFMGPLEQMKPWSMKGVEGVSRFLARVWRLVMEENQAGEWQLSDAVRDEPAEKAQLKVLHATIKKVGEDIETLSFNTAISQMMILVNSLTNAPARSLSALRTLLVILNPFAPHLTSELWETLARQFGDAGKITTQTWPNYDPQLLIEDDVEVVLQVNGKVRDRIVVPLAATDAELEAAARANAKVQELIAGKTVRKVVVVPKKLVNIVAT